MRNALLATVLLATGAAYAADGDPDLGYAGGTLSTQVVNRTLFQHYRQGVALADDGGVAIAAPAGTSSGSRATRFAVAKYRPDGGVDIGFGNGGVAQVDFSDGAADYEAYPNAIARLDGGAWLVAGHVSANFDIGVTRLHADGRLDESYANQGRFKLDLGVQEIVYDMQVDAQQRAWLLVRSTPNYLVRLTAQGQLDTSFAGTGKLALPNGSVPNGLELDVQGRIVLTALAYVGNDPRMAVRRLLPDGSVDGNFGNGGTAAIPAAEGMAIAHDVRVQADGRILVAGIGNPAVNYNFGHMTVTRLLPDGALDTAFGNGGVQTVEFGAVERSLAYPNIHIELGSDGKVTLAREVFEPVSAIRLARLLQNGRPDASFAPGGKRTLLQNSYVMLTLGRTLLARGRLILTGTYSSNAGRTFYTGAWRDGDRVFRDGVE